MRQGCAKQRHIPQNIADFERARISQREINIKERRIETSDIFSGNVGLFESNACKKNTLIAKL